MESEIKKKSGDAVKINVEKVKFSLKSIHKWTAEILQLDIRRDPSKSRWPSKSTKTFKVQVNLTYRFSAYPGWKSNPIIWLYYLHSDVEYIKNFWTNQMINNNVAARRRKRNVHDEHSRKQCCHNDIHTNVGTCQGDCLSAFHLILYL